MRRNRLANAKAALVGAKSALDKAIAALDRANAEDQRRIQTWLGAKSSTELQAVRDTLARSRVFADGAVFYCAVKTDIGLGDVYAYVQEDKAFAITLGAFFFTASETGLSSQPGVLVHELTHFVLAGGTKDPKVYGPAEAKQLAVSDPSSAQQNAENLEYFVESVAFAL